MAAPSVVTFVGDGGGGDDEHKSREVGNTLQEVTNPMERAQNIAHLENPLSCTLAEK